MKLTSAKECSLLNSNPMGHVGITTMAYIGTMLGLYHGIHSFVVPNFLYTGIMRIDVTMFI